MRKLKSIILFIIVILVSTLSAQSKILLHDTDSPNFVLNGEDFTISLKTTVPPESEKLELYLHTNLNTSLKYVEFRSSSLNKQLRFFRVEGNTDLQKIYKIESNEFETGIQLIGQILIRLSLDNNEKIRWFATPVSPERFYMTDETQINQINIYEQSEAAGKCLVLSPESSFNIDFEYRDANNILIEFWTAIGEGVDIFAELIDEITQQKITSIDLNNFGYLTIPSILDAEFFNDTYVAPNVWNYILVKIDRQRGTANIYVNNQLFYVGPVNTFSNQTSAQLVFKNLSSEGNLKIDRLKIWSFQNNVSLALSNMNYNNYRADSSQIIYSNNFDSERILKDIQTSGRVKLIESTAPIFSKAPVLRASVINQSIQLGLEVSDFTQVESYIIEKSYDGIDFSPVVTIRNIEEGKSRYTTTDYDASQNQIIYYRVKQVNIDGTETFSSVVKVGRGRQTHFKINQNYPNPFNPKTTITVDVKRAADFEVKVYDLVGTIITVLHKGALNEGTHRFEFNGTDLPSGLYFCEVQSDNDLEVMKMILAK